VLYTVALNSHSHLDEEGEEEDEQFKANYQICSFMLPLGCSPYRDYKGVYRNYLDS